ncbi:MAG: protoporphyrinogen oxidase [Thermoanaerobaculia bacterium]
MNVVIIGGGIAGLTAAYRLRKQAGADGRVPDVMLVEADSRLGGKVLTEHQDGFVLEGGPDAFIVHKPQALELVRELGLEDRLLTSNDDCRRTFIHHRGRLQPMIEGLPMLVPSRWRDLAMSPLMSWWGKLRFATESLIPARRDGDDESVADFVRRRLGKEVLEHVAEPTLAHLHVGDVERMSLQATYPRLAELERRWGSLRGGVRARRAAAVKPAGPLFWTLRDGLEELIARLVDELDPQSLILGHRAVSLRRSGPSYAVELDDGRRLEAAAMVLATPPFAAADLVEEMDAVLAGHLRELRSVSMATLSLGYRRADVQHPLDGFGFFVPRRGLRHVLACSWTSSKFDHRAPEGTVLLRVFLGGALQKDLLDLDDETLVRGVEEDLQTIMGFRATPIVRRLTRWPDGYPQYHVGHHRRVERIEAALPPGLVLAGSGYYGVGLPDCIRSGSEAAERVLASQVG